jgi:Zn finger protein HypA/HybF involved in hydrogenase expression
MALSAFCTTCQRTVYIEDGDTAECPVCSSPLMEATEGARDEEEAEDQAQAGGSK